MSIRPVMVVFALLLGGGAAAQKLCPDGTFVGGDTCKLCPDGTFVSGDTCKLAPDGTFVGGPGRRDERPRAAAGGSAAGGILSGLGRGLMRRAEIEREDALLDRQEAREDELYRRQMEREDAVRLERSVISTAETWQCFSGGEPASVVATTDTPDEPMLGSLSVAGTRHTTDYDVHGFYRWWYFGPTAELQFSITPNGEGRYYDLRDGSTTPKQFYSCRMVTAE